MDTFVYLARQPILNKEQKVFGYELLFRDSPTSQRAVIQNDFYATAFVLENVLNNIGSSKLLGNHKAFVNANREILLDPILSVLDPKLFVIEILESVKPDKDVLLAIQALHQKGYTFALDDFQFSSKSVKLWTSVFPYLSYVKIDLPRNKTRSRRKAVEFFKPKGILLLAEKVETQADFMACVKEGYDLFQGYFFAKPELVTGQGQKTEIATLLNLIQKIKAAKSAQEVEDLFLQEPDLANLLLKHLNSTPLLEKPLENFKDAIASMGELRLNHWLLLMLYSRPEMGEKPQSSALFQNASHRARVLENLAKKIDAKSDLASKAFVLGLMSHIDALLNAPFKKVLNALDIDKDLKKAILKRKGVLGQLLSLIEAIEEDSPKKIQSILKNLSLTDTALMESIHEAYL